MHNIYFFVIAISIFILDRITKWFIQSSFNLHEIYNLIPSLSLTLRYNTGAAFNFLAEESGWQRWFFVGFSFIISCILIIWLIRIPRLNRLEGLGLSFILGGALGNLYDRLFHGYVVDFILVHWQNWEYPAFNVADSAICIGVVLFAWSVLKKPAVT